MSEFYEVKVLEFDYVNWRDELHRYIVDFTTGHKPGLSLQVNEDGETKLVLSGEVLKRDGEIRELPARGRRTFEVEKMHAVQVRGLEEEG